MLIRLTKRYLQNTAHSKLNFSRRQVLAVPRYSLPKNKIVCTIGPSSDNPTMAGHLIDNGLSVARLNFSHGDFAQHRNQMVAVEQALKSRPGKYVASMLDTKGPQIRTGVLQGGKSISLKKGQKLQITTDYSFVGNSQKIACSYKALPTSTEVGGTVLIADSSITCRTTKVGPNFIEVQVLNDATLGQKKNMALPGQIVELPTVGEKDVDDIMNFGLKYQVDLIALSFARYGSDLTKLRAMMGPAGKHIKIIPKIESHQAIQNFYDIARVSDGLMVARGDLGMEIPIQKTIIAQKFLLKNCLEMGIPTITATQMLDSMEKKPKPTRAQVSDITNAVIDLTDATMLSGETTNGQYPLECVQHMNWIAQQAEAIIDYKHIFQSRTRGYQGCTSEAQILKAIKKSFDLNSDVIVCYTENGQLPKRLAKWRPKAYIIAVCPDQVVARGMTIIHGVHPVVSKESNHFGETGMKRAEALLGRHLQGIKIISNNNQQAVGHMIV